eukprot:gene8501-968_t
MMLWNKVRECLHTESITTIRRAMHVTRSCFVKERTLKGQSTHRFYEKATVAQCDGGFTVHLDNRQLKTPSRRPFIVPSEELAHIVALEWDAQGNEIRPHCMFITPLCNTALDAPNNMTPDERIDNVIPFIRTDTLCYREPRVSALKDLQQKVWDPIVQWFYMRYGKELKVTESLFEYQHEDAVEVVRSEMATMNPFEMTGFEFAADTAKSAVLALALRENAITANQATTVVRSAANNWLVLVRRKLDLNLFQKARLEVDFQTSRFGEVEWAHTLEKHDTETRLAASALLMHLTREQTS